MDALHACLLLASVVPTANYQTTNFVVTAPTPEFAQQVGEAAEFYRRELAIEWLGQEMPRWSHRCPIFCKVGEYGAGGATSFNFDRGEVFGWKMNVQGSAERILDSVLPHEVNHTIFASYFRRPLPRWADEGAASLIEHESERMRLKRIHEQVLKTNRKIPLQQLLPMREYPTDTQQVLTLYAEGYSLADYLIQQSSKAEYLQFLSIALKSGWTPALKQVYGYSSIDDLDRDLDAWIVAGSPDLDSPQGTLLARSNQPPPRRTPTIRAQSEELSVRLGSPAAWPSPTPFRLDAELARSGTTMSATGDRLDRPDRSQSPRVTTVGDGRLPRSQLLTPSLTITAGHTSLAP